MIKNFAHRGFSGKYPENTLLAFKKAIEFHADGIELDVQLTEDDEIVIIHDESIDRTTNGKGLVKDYTYEELKKFDASYIYTGKFGFNKIPTLKEYFTLIKNTNIITNIELKTSIFQYNGIEEKVYNLIKEFNFEDRVIISSFNHYSILKMKTLAPHIKCGFLTESWIINPGQYLKDNHIECYHPHFAILTHDMVKHLKKFDIEINTWTVNKEEDIRDLISKKVDILIGNFPDLINHILNES